MATIPQIVESIVLEATAMPLQQYLRTMFHPDREYVNGVAEERYMGEYEHGRVQFALAAWLMQHEPEWGISVVGECRLQVRADRFRIPDVMVLRASDSAAIHRYPTTAPLICIEVLSPEDTVARLRLVVDDYLAMGVENVWAIDPAKREVFACDAGGFHRVTELAVAGTPIRIDVADVFLVLK